MLCSLVINISHTRKVRKYEIASNVCTTTLRGVIIYSPLGASLLPGTCLAVLPPHRWSDCINSILHDRYSKRLFLGQTIAMATAFRVEVPVINKLLSKRLLEYPAGATSQSPWSQRRVELLNTLHLSRLLRRSCLLWPGGALRTSLPTTIWR